MKVALHVGPKLRPHAFCDGINGETKAGVRKFRAGRGRNRERMDEREAEMLYDCLSSSPSTRGVILLRRDKTRTPRSARRSGAVS